jgi:glycosyltransferase involved in cell wall biosynthesis
MGNLSLCICTMNRPEELRTALQSILEGSVQPHEIIVSDDGDGTAAAVAAEFPGVVYQQGPRLGLAANRNACIELATGDLIAFIDDDVKVSGEFVAVASSYSEQFAVYTGWELNHSSQPARKVTPHNASFLGFQREDPAGDYRSIVINATVFPAELFKKALFDAKIRYGYEEIDIARHAVRLGFIIRYDDALHVEHFPAASNRDGYAGVLNVSRLYITHKAYSQYDRKPLKAAVFFAVASLHHLLYSVKNGHGAGPAIRTINQARLKMASA